MIENLKSLAVFARTVELGSFRAAARALGLSPSVVSHHVSALERRLALPLLYRSTRHLALTPDGEQLYAAAREMLVAAERGLDAATGRSAAPAGRLRITAPAMLVELGFCRDLAAFSRAHPQVTLQIAFSEQRRDLLRDGFDLALRIGKLDDSTLVVRRLATMHRVLVGSPSYIETQTRPRTLRDLEAWDFIQLSALGPQLELSRRGKTQMLAIRSRVSADSVTAMRELTLAGIGIASVPEGIVRKELRRGSLVEVLPEWRLLPREIYAVWPGGTPRPGLTVRFVDHIADRLATLFTPN